jgi:hypothetical protein
MSNRRTFLVGVVLFLPGFLLGIAAAMIGTPTKYDGPGAEGGSVPVWMPWLAASLMIAGLMIGALGGLRSTLPSDGSNVGATR